MNTEQLITVLSGDDTPVRNIALRLFTLVGGTFLLAAMVAGLALGVRPDLFAAVTAPATMMKWLLPIAVAMPAMLACMALIRPQTRHTPVVLIALAAGVAALIWWLVSMSVTPWPELWPTVRGGSALICLISVVSISAIPLFVALSLLREGASPAPARSGAMAGLAVGGLATAIYAMHCTEDAPLFFLSWYSLAILIVTAIGAFAGRYILRW